MRTQTLLVTRRCNQACGFCSRVSPESADPSIASVHRLIREALADGATTLVFSGGEPLLRPDLLALVRLAKSEGVKRIVLETNATRITTTAAARALRTVGVDAVRVSLVTGNPTLHRAAPAVFRDIHHDTVRVTIFHFVKTVSLGLLAHPVAAPFGFNGLAGRLHIINPESHVVNANVAGAAIVARRLDGFVIEQRKIDDAIA